MYYSAVGCHCRHTLQGYTRHSVYMHGEHRDIFNDALRPQTEMEEDVETGERSPGISSGMTSSSAVEYHPPWAPEAARSGSRQPLSIPKERTVALGSLESLAGVLTAPLNPCRHLSSRGR